MCNSITRPTDMATSSVDEIVNRFNFEYLNIVDLDKDPNKMDFYCGITSNIEDNLKRHNVKGYAVCVLCKSYEIASEVEKKLGEMGFDIGNPPHKGNGGNPDSCIVYMIEKEAGFIQ